MDKVLNQHENKISVAETRMLCWMCGMSRELELTILERVGLAPIVKKMVKV
jgi:hypothetical protein